jgi:hypothetical protein
VQAETRGDPAAQGNAEVTTRALPGVSVKELMFTPIRKGIALLCALRYTLRFRRQRRILYSCLLSAGLLLAAGILFFALRPVDIEEEWETLPLHTRVLEEALHFLERARLSPFDAFSRYALPCAIDHFQIISDRLWQTALPDLGWRWFFYGALMTMAEDASENAREEAAPAENTAAENTLAENDDATRDDANSEVLVAFYHPWSDTALITVWKEEGREVRISDCELLMGDIFRWRGERRAATTRSWARRQQYFAAAIGHMSATSLRALELLSYPSNTRPLPQTAAPITNEAAPAAAEAAAGPQGIWRERIPFILDSENLEANHTGAGVLMLAAMNDAARYAAPTNVFAIRVISALQKLHVRTGGPKMEPGTRWILQNIPENFMEYYLPVFYANSSERAFLLLQAKRDPKKCLGFLFVLEPPEDEEDTARGPETPPQTAQIQAYDETLSNTPAEREGPKPETYYDLKLLRVDLLNLQAVYTNMFPQQNRRQ